MSTNEERIIKIIADYYGHPVADVNLDTRLRSLSDHDIDHLDVHEICGDIEEEVRAGLDDEPVASQTLTVRDFLRMVEPLESHDAGGCAPPIMTGRVK